MNYSVTEIDAYLQSVKALIKCDKYRIDTNSKRSANKDLFLKYVIDEALAKDILLSLTPYDFSEVRHNSHVGYEHELLYIFGKDVELWERFRDNPKIVSLYLKFNKLDDKLLIVISFHEQEYPIRYYFK